MTVTLDDYCALPQPQQNLVNEDYGALPIPKGTTTEDYGCLPVIGGNSEYGSLPSTNRASITPDSEYGALPEASVGSPTRFGVKPSAHRLGSSGKLSYHRSTNQ